jgi:hypothetical protein
MFYYAREVNERFGALLMSDTNGAWPSQAGPAFRRTDRTDAPYYLARYRPIDCYGNSRSRRASTTSTTINVRPSSR